MSYTAGQKLRATQMGGMYVCTSATRPDGHIGQLIYETDTGRAMMYSGSGWINFQALETVSHEAVYTQTIAQTIPTGTDRPLGFNTAVTTSADVTQGTSTGGTIAQAKFTLNRAGVWAIEAGCRWAAPNAASQYGIWIGPDNGTSRYTEQFSNAGGVAAFSTTCHTTQRFANGSTFNVYAFQNSGGNEDTAILNGSNFFRATWLRP
jgi:hypothetical protein